MIRLKNITKEYTSGNKVMTVLDNINIVINRQDFLAIMGPSGSGKSTLLHILGCIEEPTLGEYFLEDVDVTLLNDKELSRIRNEHYAFIFQQYNLIPELNVVENVIMPMVFAGHSYTKSKERAYELLKKVEMGDRLRNFPNQLSGGEQQRVAIARALSNDPTLILADEPTGNLSSRMGLEIIEILKELNVEGASIVLVTHDHRVASHAKRLICLMDGQIKDDFNMTDTFDLERYIDF